MLRAPTPDKSSLVPLGAACLKHWYVEKLIGPWRDFGPVPPGAAHGPPRATGLGAPGERQELLSLMSKQQRRTLKAATLW